MNAWIAAMFSETRRRTHLTKGEILQRRIVRKMIREAISEGRRTTGYVDGWRDCERLVELLKRKGYTVEIRPETDLHFPMIKISW